MGLTLTVGKPSDVFTSAYARKVATLLSEKYSIDPTSATQGQPWRSEELPWSGWEALQSSVAATIRKPKPFHLGSVEAWSGVFLPVQTKPTRLKVPGSDTPLEIASVLQLDKELRNYARRLRLPTGDSQLLARFDQCLDEEEDEEAEASYALLVYLELMRAVNQSLERKQPLWVVK
jgi:hypothetical protein